MPHGLLALSRMQRAYTTRLVATTLAVTAGILIIPRESSVAIKVPVPKADMPTARSLASRPRHVQQSADIEILSRLEGLLKESNDPPASVIRQFCQQLTLETIDDYLALLDAPSLESFGCDVPALVDLSIHLRWLELDAPAAVQDALGRWSAEKKSRMLPDLFGWWSEIDSASSIEYYRCIRHDPAFDERTLIALLAGSATRDFEFFFCELSTFSPSENRRAALGRGIGEMLDRGLAEDVFRVIARVNESGSLNEASFQLIANVGKRDPSLIASFVPILEIHSADNKVLASSIFSTWMEASPDEAATWLDNASTRLAAGDLQIYYRTLMNALPINDLAATEAWIVGQPTDGRLDDALSELARRIRSRDPARAERWINLIQNAEIRRRAADTLAKEANRAVNGHLTEDEG